MFPHRLVVFEARHKGPAVDIVEFLGEDPLVFCIVDFERAVWRNAVGFVREGNKRVLSVRVYQECEKAKHLQSWLNRTQICTNNVRGGISCSCPS